MIMTFISTPSHGYLKVPKNFFLASGADPEKVSKYSGMSKTLLYLEEDCDASYFINHLKEVGHTIEIEEEYRDNNNVPSHNYFPNF